MFGIGTGELLLILVIAMLVVGPERMVDYARRAGVLLAKIRAQTDEVTRDFRQALEVEAGDGDDANPLAALTQIKSEAEEAVRDLQEALTRVPSVDEIVAGEAPAAKAVQPATAAQDKAPAASEQPAPADAEGDDAETMAELESVELVDDQEVLELGGPELIEAADAIADEAKESEAER